MSHVAIKSVLYIYLHYSVFVFANSIRRINISYVNFRYEIRYFDSCYNFDKGDAAPKLHRVQCFNIDDNEITRDIGKWGRAAWMNSWNIVNSISTSTKFEKALIILINMADDQRIAAILTCLRTLWNNGTASWTLSRPLNERWCLSPWGTSNRVNPHTDSVRTFRDVSCPPKVQSRVHYQASLFFSFC